MALPPLIIKPLDQLFDNLDLTEALQAKMREIEKIHQMDGMVWDHVRYSPNVLPSRLLKVLACDLQNLRTTKAKITTIHPSIELVHTEYIVPLLVKVRANSPFLDRYDKIPDCLVIPDSGAIIHKREGWDYYKALVFKTGVKKFKSIYTTFDKLPIVEEEIIKCVDMGELKTICFHIECIRLFTEKVLWEGIKDKDLV